MAGTSSGGAIHIEADGSGDFPSLAEALEGAPSGSQIVLGPGRFILPSPTRVSKSFQLVGAGASGVSLTQVVCAGADPVMTIGSACTVTVEAVSFLHEGERAADVVVVEDAETTFSACRFEGGTSGESVVGAGLRFAAGSRGAAHLCEFAGNVVGVVVEGASAPSLQGNTLTQNVLGILLLEDSRATIAENLLRENADAGIFYFSSANGIASRNECSGSRAGIVVRSSAAPELRENSCIGNGRWGIMVDQNAAPTLEGNRCEANGESGIAYYDAATGTARSNACTKNGFFGLYVGGDATPSLVGNVSSENGSDEFKGIGIMVVSSAKPTINGNTCSKNAAAGIAYFGNGAGSATGNKISGSECGILLNGSGRPRTSGNTYTAVGSNVCQ